MDCGEGDGRGMQLTTGAPNFLNTTSIRQSLRASPSPTHLSKAVLSLSLRLWNRVLRTFPEPHVQLQTMKSDERTRLLATPSTKTAYFSDEERDTKNVTATSRGGFELWQIAALCGKQAVMFWEATLWSNSVHRDHDRHGRYFSGMGDSGDHSVNFRLSGRFIVDNDELYRGVLRNFASGMWCSSKFIGFVATIASVSWRLC